jgi:hypothetical protein
MKDQLPIIFVFVFVVIGLISFVIRTESMEGHTITSITAMQDRITHLEVTIDPHKRIEALETWARTLCVQGKDEACGKLGKVKK